MTLEQDIELLSDVELLSDFDLEQLRLLAFGAQKRDLKAGDTLYRENASADCGYIIVQGQVELSKQELDRSKIVLDHFGKGSLVGELALVTETRRVNTAIATRDTQVIRISRTIFRRVLEEFPDLAARLHKRISENVSKMIEDIERIGQKMTESEF